VAIFPRRKQNLKQIRCSIQSDITISREELDNTWENSQHKPVQTSTATSAWLLTCEGCNYTHLAGEHSNMIRKSSILRHHTHAVFRLALPINLTFHHHLTISYRTAVLYGMWSHIGNMLLSPVSPPSVDDAYFSQQKESTINISQVTWTEFLNHVKNTADIAKD